MTTLLKIAVCVTLAALALCAPPEIKAGDLVPGQNLACPVTNVVAPGSVSVNSPSFPILFGGNVTFQFDLTSTNNSSSNIVFTVDYSKTGSSFATAQNTFVMAPPSPAGTKTTLVTISNVLASEIRFSITGSTNANYISIANPIYCPWR